MSKTRKHFVLLSGGLDSTVVLYRIANELPIDDEIEAVSVNYGQRHVVELRQAQAIAESIDVPFFTIRIPDVLMGSMLTSSREIPNKSYAELPHGMSPTYVPFRNGLMISLLAAHAQKWVMKAPNDRRAQIYIGSHAEDAENDAYPDCSPEFMRAMGDAVNIGTYGMVRLATPLIAMKKVDVINYGQGVSVPWDMTWSCYEGKDVHCGKCMTCRARKAGFEAAGVKDPTQYANV